MIKHMISKLLHAGYGNIRADLPGYRAPSLIPFQAESHKPDLTAEKNSEKILVEVETDDSIYEDHTISEWMALYEYIKSNEAKLMFVAPGISRNKLNLRASQLGINNFLFVGI